MSDHLLRLCKWLYVKIMWLVGSVTMILQLSFFLDVSFAEYRNRLLRRNLEWKSSKKSPNLIRETEKENRENNKIILAL